MLDFDKSLAELLFRNAAVEISVNIMKDSVDQLVIKGLAGMFKSLIKDCFNFLSFNHVWMVCVVLFKFFEELFLFLVHFSLDLFIRFRVHAAAEPSIWGDFVSVHF